MLTSRLCISINTNLLMWIVTLAISTCIYAQNINVYVSKRGSDHQSCGSETDPCGTLYKASININETMINPYVWTIGYISIIDGQNETDINHYISLNNTDNYDPCLPIPFSPERHIFVAFNSTSITETTDWYPYHLCQSLQYKNEYMFEGGRYMQISNLIVKDYVITGDTTSYPLIRSGLYLQAYIGCNKCIFENITSSITEYPLMHTLAQIDLSETQVTNINIQSRFIFASHSKDLSMASRLIIFDKVTFSDIVSAEPILYLPPSDNDVSYIPTVNISNSNFKNIHAETNFIDDSTKSCNVNIINSNINMVNGSFYRSVHSKASTILINNVNISANGLSFQNEFILLSFGLFDETNVRASRIVYSYDLSESCYFVGNNSNTLIGYNCSVFRCYNPPTAIQNNGKIELKDVIIDMNILPDKNTESICKEYWYISDDSKKALFQNSGVMDVANVMLQDSITENLFLNEYQLSITNLSFDESFITNYEPNRLHSRHIINQIGPQSSTTVQSSNLVGGMEQIIVEEGSIKISHTTLQKGTYAFAISNANGVTISDCEIRDNGAYYGRFLPDTYSRHSDRSGYKPYAVTTPLQISYSDNILFANNLISTYDPDGLLLMNSNRNVSLIGNRFDVDTTGLYYDISFQTLGFLTKPIEIKNTENSMSMRNYFGLNNVSSIDWVAYTNSIGMHCLTGNTFVERAIYTWKTDLTSCFRPALVNHSCITEGSEQCSDQIYGEMNMETFNQTGNFIINGTDEWVAVIRAFDSHVALDNIKFTILTDQKAYLYGSNSKYLLVDAFVESNGNDIRYGSTSYCNIAQNNRLQDDNAYISQLFIECKKDEGETNYVSKTMDSENTKFINYLSAVQINLTAHNSMYYPGQSLMLTFDIMDRFGNKVPKNLTQTLTIYLTHESFSTGVFIDESGSCIQCVNGLVLDIVSLKRNYNQTFIIDISVADDVLYSTNDKLSLHIVGCPTGYGPDGNNIACNECVEGYFNNLPNNVNECKSCQNQRGIKCTDATVYVSENYWMEINGDNIVSAQCPSEYCCRDQNEAGCDYMNGDTDLLCALNRDHTSPLCGKCKDGYSQSMNSAACVKCKIGFNVGYLFLPLLLSIAFGLILMGTNTEKVDSANDKSKEEPSRIKRVLKSEYCQLMLKIMFFKCTMYYQQAITQILDSSGFAVLFHSIAALFNVSAITNSTTNEDNLWCFADGLTSKGKILIDTLVPLMIGVIIGSTYLYYKFKAKKPMIVRQRQVNFGKTSIATFTMIIGKLLDVIFRLLSCKKVGDQSVHTFFGEEDCGGITQVISALSLIAIIFCFGMIFVKLKRMDMLQRQNPKTFASVITSKYKPQYFYWEFLLFIRRVLIALYAVYIENVTLKFLFVGIMLYFAFLQHVHNPFIIHQANKMEFILNMCFIFIVISQLIPFIDVGFLNAFISIMILLPVILGLYYLYQLTKVNTKDMEQDLAANMVNSLQNQDQKQSALDEELEENNTKEMEMVGTAPNDTGIPNPSDMILK